VPAPAAGRLAKILVHEDETILVGGALGEIEVGVAPEDGKVERPSGRAAGRSAAPDEQPAATGEAPLAGEPGAEESEPSRAPAAAGRPTPVEEATPAASPEHAKSTPVARRVAAAHGIEGGAATPRRPGQGLEDVEKLLRDARFHPAVYWEILLK
jgi:pyruvate/2-oxoglutarate dehydrogenase complex dihydrolipoamide acyltransferase (E2) component